MLTKLRESIRHYAMLAPGDTVYAAVSGGADSMALLWGLYLLRDTLDITLRAAHFNHGLRGAESDRDADFVRDFCSRYAIPLTLGTGPVVPGKKGLEAAARAARYGFFQTLPGKIATAHTADDNAETVLMHLVRGTGLRGLGGIPPVRGKIIRPMLDVPRTQVEDFLREYHISHVEDSTNHTDDFLRNRLRRRVLPLLAEENPRIGVNLSAMAQSLREDEAALDSLSRTPFPPSVDVLRQMAPAVRKRALAAFLQTSGVLEPEARHIALAESLVFSENPSAKGNFPGGVTLRRCYGHLEAGREAAPPAPVLPDCPGISELPQWGLRIACTPAAALQQTADTFCVCPVGTLVLRSRQPGDTLRTPAGSRSLKKLLIDRKIPAHLRDSLPVLADDRGVLGVFGLGPNLDRVARELPALQIHWEIHQPKR